MKAVQSAMAIRRQRRRRDEALRAKARRASHQSDHLMLSDSGDAGSMLSLDGVHNHNGNGGGGSRSAAHRHRQMMGGITTFHVGVVFFIMGLMLLISGILPGYANRQHQYWEEPTAQNGASATSTIWNREGSNRNAPLLLVTGSFLILVGIALVVANRIATRREDELFSRYISRKLAPARMTHQPVSSLLHPAAALGKSANGHGKDETASSSSDDLDRVISESSSSSSQQQQEPQCQSPGQLESITEESEAAGAERPLTSNKDELFWTSDVAPVHHHSHSHHHRGHHHGSGSSSAKVLHSEQDKCNHDNHQHNHHMIGAMPAVAVRHERQKQSRQQGAAFGTSRDTLFSNGVSTHHIRRSSRPVRPNHLPLGNRQRMCSSTSSVSSIVTPSYLSPVPLSSSASTCATPVNTLTTLTPRQVREPLTAEEMATDYCCYGKPWQFPLLHVIVISLIIGITLMIVGLVQLKPNADSEAKKYLFLGSAAVCFVVGFISLAIRALRRYQFRKCGTAQSRRILRDESGYSFCELEDQDRATPVDSIALLQQRGFATP